MRSHWSLIRVWDVLYAAYHFCFQRLALFEKFANAFGIDVCDRREALKIAGLAAGSGLQVAVFGSGDL